MNVKKICRHMCLFIRFWCVLIIIQLLLNTLRDNISGILNFVLILCIYILANFHILRSLVILSFNVLCNDSFIDYTLKEKINETCILIMFYFVEYIQYTNIDDMQAINAYIIKLYKWILSSNSMQLRRSYESTHTFLLDKSSNFVWL